MSKLLLTFGVAALLIAVAGLLSCGGNGGSMGSGLGSGGGNGTVTTTISDPATCLPPNGQFKHVFVTVADVKASTNANAGDNDSSFVDLTPGLKPVQVDLLSAPATACFLAQLAQNTSIPSGSYQQIRIILLSNNATAPANNQCGTSVNCVVLSNNTTQPLQLSSEATTGIKIPSGQIAGGQLVVAAGSGADLDIDFNACESVVPTNTGGFRLKPVLHAGEVSLTASSITGNVIDSATNNAINGGTTIVALEQQDASGVERVIMQTTADGNGNFVLCPVSDGTYDVVIDAVDGSGTVFAATITTGVQPGNNLSNVPLIATSGGAAALTGQVNTQAGGTSPTSADVSVSALQSANSVPFTIPLPSQSATALSVTTVAGGACAANSECASYTLNLPVANPNVGAFGSAYAQASGAVNYTVDGQAFVPNTPATPDCSPQDMQVAANNVTSGSNSVGALNFAGCQ